MVVLFYGVDGNKDILNFGKVRLSYANVGSDEDPYNLAFKYTPASTYFCNIWVMLTLSPIWD